MITNLRRRTAMAAAGLGAALGLGILLVPTVDAHLANGSMSEVMMSEIAGLPIPPKSITGRLPMPPAARRAKRGTSAHRREQSKSH